MANQETLNAKKREVSGTSAAKRLRRDGIVPAVVYGSDQREYMIQVSAKEFGTILRKQSSRSFLVNLEIDGAEEKSKLAMVQAVQQNPLTGGFIHIDFNAVNEDATLNATLPLELLGEPAGVKAGGLLEQLLHTLEIQCRPADLPDRIEIDVSDIEIGGSVHVGEINFPEGVSTTMNTDVLVAIVNESRVLKSEGGLDEDGEALPAEEGEAAAAPEGGEG